MVRNKEGEEEKAAEEQEGNESLRGAKERQVQAQRAQADIARNEGEGGGIRKKGGGGQRGERVVRKRLGSGDERGSGGNSGAEWDARTLGNHAKTILMRVTPPPHCTAHVEGNQL